MKKKLLVIVYLFIMLAIIISGIYFSIVPLTPSNGPINFKVMINIHESYDIDSLDLNSNPIELIFTRDFENGEKFEQKILFDSKDKINNGESVVLDSGTYNYKILSTYILFEEYTGEINIKDFHKSRLIIFNSLESPLISFNVRSWENSNTILILKSNDNDGLSYLKEKLGDSFNIYINFYDLNFNKFESLKHKHPSPLQNNGCYVQGSCPSLVYYPDNNFLIQLVMQSLDSKIQYISTFVNVSHNSYYSYEINYSINKG